MSLKSLLKYRLLIGAAGLAAGYLCRKPAASAANRIFCTIADLLGKGKRRHR